MKAIVVLLLCLLSGPLLAAGIYEIDRGQWEQKPAATAKPAASRTAPANTKHVNQQTQTTTQTKTSTQTKTPATTSAPSASDAAAVPQGDVAQSCAGGQHCGELQ